jgi:hypothetical protein
MPTATRQRRPLLRAGIALAALALVAGCGGGGTKSVSSIRSCLQKKHLTTTPVAVPKGLTARIMIQARGGREVRIDVFSKAKDAKSEYGDLKAVFGPSGIGKGGGAKLKDKTVVAHPYRIDPATLKSIEGCAF